MQKVAGFRISGLILAAALTLGAAFSATAVFEAPQPGAILEPSGDAADLVSLVQGQEHILWTSLTGVVSSFTVTGWPSNHAGVELGGGITIERPEEGTVGVIDFGERPMTVTFELDG